MDGGITMATLLTWIDGALNTPGALFDAICQQPFNDRHLGLAALWVAVISAIQPLVHGNGVVDIVLGSILAVIGGLISWVCLGLIVQGAAYVFGYGQTDRLNRFLLLSALALTPWLAVPSLTLLQHSQLMGLTTLAALLQLALWFWSLGLLCLALSKSYQMAWPQVIVALMLIPFVGLLGWGALFNGFGHLISLVS
jgi:hypothetical protein